MLKYGQELSASRVFETDEMRSGALKYNFAVMKFKDKDSANTGYESTLKTFLNDYAAFMDLTFFDTAEVKVSPFGNARHGVSTKFDVSGTTAVLSFIFINASEPLSEERTEPVVYVNAGIGFADSTAELDSIMTTFFEADPAKVEPGEGTPEANAELLSYLPILDQMPVGFRMSTERVSDPEE